MANKEIEIHEEQEFQLLASDALFEDIRAWLETRDISTRKKPAFDHCTYYDTQKFHLLRNGIEYRVKEKGKTWRHDMKLGDMAQSGARPDSTGRLTRHELKCETSPRDKPSLKRFREVALLQPVLDHVKDFFGKKLVPCCKASFYKEKIDLHLNGDADCIEYSFQTGHMATLDGNRKTPTLHILELELRHGSEEAQLEEMDRLLKTFPDLRMLPKRKVVMGFELMRPELDRKAQEKLDLAIARNVGETAAQAFQAEGPRHARL